MKFTEPALDNLINLISRLPGLGPKSARRIALYLLKNKDSLMKIEKEKIINWLIWSILIILWNYIWPEANPIEDVLVAFFLSILLVLINRLTRSIRKKRARR